MYFHHDDDDYGDDYDDGGGCGDCDDRLLDFSIVPVLHLLAQAVSFCDYWL
jgi:hypothetical protein